MKMHIASLLLMLFWVGAMNERMSAPVQLCASCEKILDARLEPIVQVGCAQKHMFHKGCMQGCYPEYYMRGELVICPIPHCSERGAVDQHEIYEIMAEEKKRLFPPYNRPWTGKSLVRFIKDKWRISNDD